MNTPQVKVGDKVRALVDGPNGARGEVGDVYEVVDVESAGEFHAKFDGMTWAFGPHCFTEGYLELVTDDAAALPFNAIIDDCAVGDLDSDAKGSGARKNAGKPRMELVPVEFWLGRWAPYLTHRDDKLMRCLGDFQQGDDRAVTNYLKVHCPEPWIDAAVDVLAFGAEKYKAWNWAKGMPWSVCFGCILRHVKAYAVLGEVNDPESGLPHMGHAVCNLIFLAYYVDHYPEGDDRPPSYGD